MERRSRGYPPEDTGVMVALILGMLVGLEENRLATATEPDASKSFGTPASNIPAGSDLSTRPVLAAEPEDLPPPMGCMSGPITGSIDRPGTPSCGMGGCVVFGSLLLEELIAAVTEGVDNWAGGVADGSGIPEPVAIGNSSSLVAVVGNANDFVAVVEAVVEVVTLELFGTFVADVALSSIIGVMVTRDESSSSVEVLSLSESEDVSVSLSDESLLDEDVLVVVVVVVVVDVIALSCDPRRTEGF
uniref:Uncharacterized protein n=1 Tax=Anopheles minimus TaxID=112268 RepID=A0A182VXI9_9DIPT